MTSPQSDLLPLASILEAGERLKGIVLPTPLAFNPGLSEKYQCRVFLKREDLQWVRSYKLRGAYNRMALLSEAESSRGVVCASAGNHAQGVAFSCHALGVRGWIYMPHTTPRQKIRRVRHFGKQQVEVVLTGDTYDAAYEAARAYAQAEGLAFIHPFDDPAVIAGQGTLGQEILSASREQIDFLFLPVGGGGLAAGLGCFFRQLSPRTQIIGAEPAGAPSMTRALEAGQVLTLPSIDKFVDGAAVRRVGEESFRIARQALSRMVLVPEGLVCATLLELYDEEAIVAEPAGALSVAALSLCRDEIRGKTVVCVLSGGNNDILRMEDIKERALLFRGLKHYFLIQFPQRAGALREFLEQVLGPRDDITHFEYTQKNNRERGPALVGIELEQAGDFQGLMGRMDACGVEYEWVNDKPMLFNWLV